MIEQLIENIIDAERNADEIVRHSNIEAKQIVAKAAEDAIKIIKNANDKVKDDMKIASNNANVLASKQYAEAIGVGTVEAEKKVKEAQGKQKDAVDFIIGSFKAKYGNI